MAAVGSLVWTGADLDAPGKLVTYLYVPHSVTRSAYGAIAVPVAVISNGDGPSVLLTGGNHGDEFESQIVLTTLIQYLEPKDVRGRLIILPALNLPAAMAGQRVSPVDGGNLNRLFPGDPLGTPTQQIAYFVDSVLLPQVEAWIDLHSAGSSLDELPFAFAYVSGQPEVDERALSLLTAFGAPMSMIWEFQPEPRAGGASAIRHGVPYLGTEIGGAGRVSPECIGLMRAGLARALGSIGALAPGTRLAVPPASSNTQYVELLSRDYYVYASDSGLFEPSFRLGEVVVSGGMAGRIHFVDDPLRAPIEVRFSRDGIVICARHPGRVERGDCVAQLATPVTRGLEAA